MIYGWFGLVLGLIFWMIYGNALLVCSRAVLVVLLAMLNDPTLSLNHCAIYSTRSCSPWSTALVCVCDVLSSPSPLAHDGEKLLGLTLALVGT
jgi:hypothetical protein